MVKRRIATAATLSAPLASDQDSALTRRALEAFSAIMPSSSTSEQDAGREDMTPMRNAVETPPVVTPTYRVSKQDAKREDTAPMYNAVETPPALTQTLSASEQGAIMEDPTLTRNAVETPAAVTPIYPVPEQDEDTVKEDVTLAHKATEVLEAILQADASRPGEKKTWTMRGVEKGKRMFSQVKNFYDRMGMGEVVRLIAKGYSIKFIAVIGLTGAGKSSIIKTLTDSDVHIEHSINAGTNTFEMFPTIIDSQRYILIDTPGFNDQNRDDVEIFQEILQWFVTMTPYCDLAGILYVHDITHKRFDHAANLNLRMLEALCGEQFYKNVTIITTMWGDMAPLATKAAERRQEQFKRDPWKKLIEGGTRVFAHRHGFVEPELQEDEHLLEDGEVDNSQMQHEDTENERHQAEEQRGKALDELCEMMKYYINSERIRPQIQSELLRKVEVMKTEAGLVLLREKYGPSATMGTTDGNESSSAPNSQATTTGQTNNDDRSPPSPPSCPTGQVDGDTSRNPIYQHTTTEQIGGERSTPSPPSQHLADKGASPQSQNLSPPDTTAHAAHHSHRHHRTFPLEVEDNKVDAETEKGEEEKKDEKDKTDKKGEEKTKDNKDEEIGWFRSMWRAIKRFFGYS